MGEVINLRLARKAKARSLAAQHAAAKRAQHGQTKAAIKLSRAEADRASHQLDQAQREGKTD